ncbi:MAG: RsmE family RNA methyltransferase [Candidatus Paceibacterota bacterium]|jgi:16S rRNA (uracil1498-N3)-methyltransferase
MRLHRFFVSEQFEVGKRFTVTDENIIHQWRLVFRYKTGIEVILFNGSGFDFTALITDLRKDAVEVEVVEKKKSSANISREIYLFSSLIKKDNYEWVLEKCTELGVSYFVPIISARTEKKDINPDRAVKIITEAAEQSGRGTVPTLFGVMDIASAVQAFAGEKIQHIVFDGSGKQFAVDEFEKSEKVGIWIGPEGGWSDGELAGFKELKMPIVKVGSGQVLRAETATVAVVSLTLL